ncbi:MULTISPECIES: phage portal protein [Clostridium]|uniref:phage portal protein n=1 Tax=Clostridium TaxID=1485 RepID=UPI000DFD2A9C|nr:phage portal protein [Clostridium sporogenes]MCW6085571.1 phage portal protein [Clostridium sporogenes]STC76633.1 phage portal protein [Clostridium botulinum]
MDIRLLKKCYEDYKSNKGNFDKMYQYYIGDSDAIRKYSAMEYQESHKMNFNYLKKFIKEEVAYSVGTSVGYISKTNDDNIVQEIEYYTYHWDKNHDAQLMKNILLYSTVYELYYVDKEGQFNGKVITPRNGYAYTDDFGNILYFFHVYKLKFDDKTYIDIYTDTEILHYDENFKEVKKADTHIFGQVPVTIGVLSEELEKDTLFNDVKDIQDGYSVISSDGVNEITNTRAAILVGKGFQLTPEQIETLKKHRFANLPKSKEASLEWLLKNLNADYQRLMLETLEDKMYQLSFHINNQEKMQSNTSSLALRSRLINLEQKTKLNNKALMNVIISRIKFLFKYLKIIKNKDYDYRNIAIKFNSVVPSDDLMISQIISQLGDRISLKTGLSQLSFVENADAEIKQIQKENEENDIGENLLEEAEIDEIE